LNVFNVQNVIAPHHKGLIRQDRSNVPELILNFGAVTAILRDAPGHNTSVCQKRSKSEARCMNLPNVSQHINFLAFATTSRPQHFCMPRSQRTKNLWRESADCPTSPPSHLAKLLQKHHLWHESAGDSGADPGLSCCHENCLHGPTSLLNVLKLISDAGAVTTIT